MKLNKKEQALINKANENLKNKKPVSYANDVIRADRWTRSNVYRNRKAYSRKEKHRPVYQVCIFYFGFIIWFLQM